MTPTRPALLVVGAIVYLLAPRTPLRVLRASPTDAADRSARIVVTFDRPVAGSLDRTVNPNQVLSVEPAIDGSVEWRDPVTVMITPRSLLEPNARYTVTVTNDFEAMDGSRLARPFSFSFRVRGPQLIAGSPADGRERARFLTPTTRFELVYSSPVDLALLSATANLRLGAECSGERTVRLKAESQRHVTNGDPYSYRTGRDAVDSLRRVVRLVPERQLPLACSGDLRAPKELAEGRSAVVAWQFFTYGPLHVDSLTCAAGKFCPTGPLVAHFSTPVTGAEVARSIRIFPSVRFTVRDTITESARWVLQATLAPHTTYAVVADTSIRDVFAQRIAGNPAAGFRTTGYEPSIGYDYGRITVEKSGFGTLAVRHVNVDTLVVTVAPVPDSLEGLFLRRSQWNLGDLWKQVRSGAKVSRIAVRAGADVPAVTGIRLPALTTGSPRHPALLAVKIERARPDSAEQAAATIAVVQVTDLGVHAKIGAESGVVWVTGMEDGAPRPGARVRLLDFSGREVAKAVTDERGIATFPNFEAKLPSAGEEPYYSGFEGYVIATLGDDRALTGVSEYDPDLSPWNFNVQPAWGSSRIPVAGAVFTERGIYRPGEQLYAKAIVRTGSLGALAVPAKGDSLRWLFSDRDQGMLSDTTVALSSFGTAEQRMSIPDGAPLGTYQVELEVKRGGRWFDIARTDYRVAEYRPPEFLVDMSADSAPRFPGDSMRAHVQARYLFGAPMARASFTWQARAATVSTSSLEIPNTDGYFIGESGWWWEDDESGGVRMVASGVDTLDARGEAALAVRLPEPVKGRAARVTISAAVQDVNRQVAGAQSSVTVHPASFYVAAKPLGESFFWTEGEKREVGVMTVRPGGERVSGVKVSGTVARREWHQVHRERDGVAETVGEWVIDTVARCSVTTGTEPAACAVTPPAGGMYVLTFRARDEKGRETVTEFYRWATGKEWVPWNDESRFKVDVIPDRNSYSVGDTATVLFASPFTDSEAWITVEREGLIEQRRMKLESGSTTLRFPITEKYAPNAFVSVFIVRGRSAPPGRLDDVGRPTIRVGYAELRVTPEVKRLTVNVDPLRSEYRPGDTARVRLEVHDVSGTGRRAEVTLWAVDQGVLALTGYTTPDPIDLLYQPRGLGLRLASNMANVAPQIPEGEKGRRSPGGGGGADRSDILRSRFRPTAFFLGSVVTDSTGRATASAKLPDNLTTFRVMAVAVTAGDRYGNGESQLLVTRPLVARPALPRFTRPGDSFDAGVVVNERAGGTPRVQVRASAKGVQLRGDDEQSVMLEAGRGREVRFPFRTTPGDSASFRFDASMDGASDAVRIGIPIRPDYHPRAFTVSGVLSDTGSAELALPAGIDPVRSRVTFTLGASPFALLRGVYDRFHVYPYYCTEQVVSVAAPLLALYTARDALGDSSVGANTRAELERAVQIVSGRQLTGGGIGYWSPDDWTSPWLSAYAGNFLLGARAAGITVSDSVLARLGDYLVRELRQPLDTLGVSTPLAGWYRDVGVRLSERVAAADFLSRAGRAHVAVENQLLARVAQLRWEDRALLAELFARRGDERDALRLLEPLWRDVRVEGNRAVLPVNTGAGFYFTSRVRPVARLITATLATRPSHPLLGPLVQTLVQEGRGGQWVWNTQDAGSLAEALVAFDAGQKRAARRGIRVRGRDGRVLFTTAAGGVVGDTSLSLEGLLSNLPGDEEGRRLLRVSLDTRGAATSDTASFTAYYFITVREVPREPPVTPFEQGIQVERWYESYEARKPLVSVAEGQLVRVRVRVTVKEERHFVVLDDALPAGLEAVDLSLRTTAALPGPGASVPGGMDAAEFGDAGAEGGPHWGYGSWDAGWWTPWDHRELRDDRVVYAATVLWPGSYMATYIARATTPGVFVRPPAHAEEMYNPAVNGRSDGGVFTVTK
jgi:Large extracellular alpha-helical protein